MRSIRLLLPVLASMALLTACGGGTGTAPTTSMPAVGPASPISPDNNGKFTQGTLPIPAVTESVPCTGGLDLTFGGSMNYRAHTVVRQKNTKVSIHTTFDGLTAVDSAGNSYTFKGVGNAQVVIPNGGTLHGVGVGNLIAVGTGPDAGVRAHVKVAIGADSSGNIVLTFTSIHIICH